MGSGHERIDERCAGQDRGLISVVVPAHNEDGSLRTAIGTLSKGLAELGRPHEIIVCENGSTDRTRALAEELAVEHAELRVVTSEQADYGRALRDGFLSARGDLIVNFDVDLVDMQFLEQALALAEHDADIVIGSKRTSGADDTRPFSRRLVTGIFSAVLHHGFGLTASDTHGLKLLRREPTAPLVAACSFGGDIFDTELVLRAEHAGLRISEIPVKIVEQRPARTAIASRIPRTLKGLARLRILLWREQRASARLGIRTRGRHRSAASSVERRG
jgi:glycosyltransferase involved in cell wall biosynthesis